MARRFAGRGVSCCAMSQPNIRADGGSIETMAPHGRVAEMSEVSTGSSGGVFFFSLPSILFSPPRFSRLEQTWWDWKETAPESGEEEPVLEQM